MLAVLLIVIVVSFWSFFSWHRATLGQKRTAWEVLAHLFPALLLLALLPLHWVMFFADGFFIDEFHMPPSRNVLVEVVHFLLWLLAALAMRLSVRRGEQGRPFTLWVLLLLDIGHIALLLFSLVQKGFSGFLTFLPVGSRPMTRTMLAFLMLYILIRVVVILCFIASIAMQWYGFFARRRLGGDAARSRRRAVCAGIVTVLLPFVGCGLVGEARAHLRPFGEPLILIELEDLRDGTRTTYACNREGRMRAAEPFHGDTLAFWTGANVYRKDYFNGQLRSEVDESFLTDAQGDRVRPDATCDALLREAEREPGYIVSARLIRDGDACFLEAEIEDGLWRPFRLYGYDGERLILLASYDSRQVTALKVVQPEAFGAHEPNTP